jgi:hypothetical protein
MAREWFSRFGSHLAGTVKPVAAAVGSDRLPALMDSPTAKTPASKREARRPT